MLPCCLCPHRLLLLPSCSRGLLRCGLQEPPEKVQDRIHFIMNNLSAQNVDGKYAEIKDLVR